MSVSVIAAALIVLAMTGYMGFLLGVLHASNVYTRNVLEHLGRKRP